MASAVDDTYQRFVERLPEGLGLLASRKGTFDNRSGMAPFSGPSQLNAINCGASWLFWEACRQLPDDQLLPQVEAGAFFGLAYILLDHLVDGQPADMAGTTLLQSALHEQAVRRLSSLFPAGDPFWVDFDRLSAGLRASLELELATRADPARLSLETFRLTAKGKVAPSVITLAAAARLTGNPDLLSLGEASLGEAINAGQLGHDVGDWRLDLANGHLTYFLSRCAPVEAWTAAEWPAEAVIEEHINDGWLDVEHYKLARGWFEQARQLAGPLSCTGWTAYLDHYLGIAEDSISGSSARHLLRKLG